MAGTPPVPPLTHATLEAVAVFSPQDVWAVGFAAEHWIGNRWRRDFVFPRRDGVEALATVSPQELWAFGAGPKRVFAYHYACLS
jgi:hypothetical protein